MAFPWTKFQDFYLRLGFLKALALSLDPDRRSALNQAIERRLARPLFEQARKHQQLWTDVRVYFPDDHSSGSIKFTTVAQALLVSSGCPSSLFAITPETSYKVLNWGHDVYFVGRGNQISERALVLRALMDVPSADEFLAGDACAWNPFVLTIQEKIFFLYHLAEIDQLTVLLIEGLAERDTNNALETGDAARLMCRRFFGLLSQRQSSLLPRETPKYRIALDLACVIADELGLSEFSSVCGAASGARRIGRSVKRAPLSRAGQHSRRTTKSADHQTIPRFEQLTDLGFLTKTNSPISVATSENIAQRARWRYIPTDACRRWGTNGLATLGLDKFLFQGFAHSAVRAYGLGPPRLDVHDGVSAQYLWRAYEKIRRPVGHTPFDSVALLAMIYAAVDGVAIEMSTFHTLMLRIKQQEVVPNHAFFASGNEIDKMFILLKPGFLQALDVSNDVAGKATR
ncbi:MAG: hypothetical protein ACREVC_05175 [Burkholderiales bacterium]